jgi:hypothetical protein
MQPESAVSVATVLESESLCEHKQRSVRMYRIRHADAFAEGMQSRGETRAGVDDTKSGLIQTDDAIAASHAMQ